MQGAAGELSFVVGSNIHRSLFRAAAALTAVLAGAVSPAAASTVWAAVPPPSPAPSADAMAAVRSTEPVVLTGAQFPAWSGGPELTVRAPEPPTDYSVADSQGAVKGTPTGSDCYDANPGPDVNGSTDSNHNDHNCFQKSQLPVRTVANGVDPNSLRGYRWDASTQQFVQIPFQVDTKWTHYISNNASGFAFYSGVDQELTYTFAREGFRFTSNAPFDPTNPGVVCQALPAGGVSATPDPNPGLINSDELVFMARDAGPGAPSGAKLPAGIVDAQQVQLTDPLSGATSYAYVMRSGSVAGGGYAVNPAYTASNSPYVHYARDANADTFAYSQSSYSNYGNAPKGPVCTPDGAPVIGQGFALDASGHIQLDPKTYVQRRPLDNATVTSPRYRFRFDGRWLMDTLQVSPDDRGLAVGDYGPSIIDRFKGRAFQQSPGGNTPCCGYEDEQNNWGGSSQLMGEKAGPVRAIRVTWGADSGTNVVRADIFYADQIDHNFELRVHPIPPLDGIYTQWDMAAGRVSTYYNPYNPGGVPVSGINPELYGNVHAYAGPSGVSYDSADRLGAALRQANGGKPLSAGSPTPSTCGNGCINGDFDVPDASFSGVASEALSWDQFDGNFGGIVEKWGAHAVSPVGTPAAAVATVPYYRDDACFDDGTGSDPGPHLARRSPDEPRFWWTDPVTLLPTSGPKPPAGVVLNPRRCWNHHADGTPYNIPGTSSYDKSKPVEAPDAPPDPSFSPLGDVRYYQGDIGTHGLHIEIIGEADNAQLTAPVDEVDSDQHQTVLPPLQGNVGQSYADGTQVPLAAVETPWTGPAASGSAGASHAGPPAPAVDTRPVARLRSGRASTASLSARRGPPRPAASRVVMLAAAGGVLAAGAGATALALGALGASSGAGATVTGLGRRRYRDRFRVGARVAKGSRL